MKRIGAFLLLVALAGCSSTTSVYLLPGENLNPDQDAGAKATPVQVKIYQLVQRDEFMAKDFEEIWTKPDEALKGVMLGTPIEKVVNPRKVGAKDKEAVVRVDFTEEKGLRPETHCFGVAVLFNPKEIDKQQQGKWKDVVNLKEAGDWYFVLDGYEIKLKRN